MTIQDLFSFTVIHQREHGCGGHPYQNGEILIDVIEKYGPHRVLEVGTALGYTSSIMALSRENIFIETIDQDATHLEKARKYWSDLNVSHKIDEHEGKAEEILPTLIDKYDLIFFDGYTPQLKLLDQFEKLLKKDGILVTANLYLSDEKGGRYVSRLKNASQWKTTFIADTAIAQKLF